MGKIIVRNIKGIGWKAKVALIAMFTLVFTVLIYQGWQNTQQAHATVAAGTAWSNIHAAAPGTTLAAGTNVNTTSTGTFTAGAGTNRILLVAVYYEIGTASTATFTTTIGGVAVTQIATSGATSGREHVWLGYVKDASIPAAASTVVSGINCATASTLSSISIKVGTYTGVDQGTPIVGSNGVLSATTTVATNAAVSYLTGGMTVFAAANGGTPVTQAITATPTLTDITAADNTTNHSTYVGASAAHTSASSYASGGISFTYSGTTSARSALAVASLRPATTTLGNGVAGTTANVAPGAAGQKLDGFSFVTSSAGTTDSITGLTVTTTNQAAIASMQVWNEAGTTQYFATVSNPGSNTWSFSGGTPIPATSTAANYKVLVTYKTRAGGAPAGNTATTANVTAFTSANIAAGTDTADTTLTLINTHAASTWGTNTAGSAQITLNWTYGTAGQSVVIIRYTAKTDTTKPVDGTTYTLGSAFGTGGTVRYVGTASTFTDSVGLSNGTTYYYKIFEYDTYSNYYNATDVWTAGLTPISPDAVPPAVDAGFAATTPVNAVNVPITSFSATDNVGGSGVAGYLITTTSTQPSAGAAGWTTTPPATFTVAGDGTYTLYPWAKDGGSNVSPLYASPVTVVVDTTPPTVPAFTVSASVATRNIPIGSFTGTDGATGVVGYMITTSSTPPVAGAAGWTGTAPATYTVASDGTYTLYPWVKDGAGNVSAAFATPRTVLVDTAPPTGLAATSPSDTATGQSLSVALQSTTATDSGSGGVQYWFKINSIDLTYSQNSGWIAGTSFAPAGLSSGITYVWSVKARDALGNETAFTAPMTFTTTAPCVRNDPTVTLLTSTGGTASTITTDGGTSLYNLKLINNDYGGCPGTTFNLSASDTDLLGVFDLPQIAVPSVTLAPGAQTTTTLTMRGTPGKISGVTRTTATVAADAYHNAQTTFYVQTTLNVVGCTANTPLLIIGPNSGYLNRGGAFAYTVTVKNTDTGTGCPAITYNLSIPSESNTTDFNASQFSSLSLILNAGELSSATLTVSAKATAAKNAVNLTTVAMGGAGHASPANVTVTSTVNNPMLHNSDNTLSTKWGANGGWGIPGGRYGEFVCGTCHIQGGLDTSNIKRVRESVFAPVSSVAQLPGAGQTIAFRRLLGSKPTDPVLGWDSGATPRTSSSKICEVCHTYDATGTNGVKVHPNATGATLGNHVNADGTDCIRCHKHQKGFGVKNLNCTGCHGTPTDTAGITAATRYVVAPPINTYGATGALTGVGQVSNDPKVGAHQTHLKLLNGFTNYSTVDFRCQNCHGPVPTDLSHVTGSSTPAFQDLATHRGSMAPSFNAATRTCSNTYCHNPAGTGGTLLSTNAGSNVFPSWTSAGYVSSGTKSVANCSVCHKVPGVAGFEPAATHAGMSTDTQDCSGCHGHNGDASGTVPGKRHMDGIKYGGGDCNSCHDYDTVGASYSAGVWTGGTWGKLPYRDGLNPGEGWGAHFKHINYIKTRLNIATVLDPTNQTFGAGTPANICGTCHTNLAANHTTGGSTVRSINFGDGLFKIGGTTGVSIVFGSANPVYNGTSGVSSNSIPKTCSNISCHYFTTPVWSTY